VKEWLTFTDDWFNQLRINGNDRTKKIFNDLDTRNIWKVSKEVISYTYDSGSESGTDSDNNMDKKLDHSNNKLVINDICIISSGYKGPLMVHTGKLVDIIDLVPKDIIIKRTISLEKV
jgi:hypothetical protein